MGNVGREGALEVLPAAMPTEPQLPVAATMLYFPAELLDCHAGRHPLKPPIYKVMNKSIPFPSSLLSWQEISQSPFQGSFLLESTWY
jgi:hypothetical protein